MFRKVILALLVGFSLPARATQEPEPYPVKPFRQTPDIRELERAKTLLRVDTQAYTAGPIVPAVTQPTGALSGRVVFTSAGHGWDWTGSAWALGRPVLYEMNEDYGNVDQMSLFAYYCFNAGATVVAFRPIGNQTNEVVLDNDSPGVTWSGSWVNGASSVFFGTAGDVGSEADLELLKSSTRRQRSGPSRVDTAMISNADHMYTGEEAQVAQVIATWIDNVVLPTAAKAH